MQPFFPNTTLVNRTNGHCFFICINIKLPPVSSHFLYKTHTEEFCVDIWLCNAPKRKPGLEPGTSRLAAGCPTTELYPLLYSLRIFLQNKI